MLQLNKENEQSIRIHVLLLVFLLLIKLRWPNKTKSLHN